MAGLFAWLNDALGDTNMGSMPPSMLDPSGGGGQPPMPPGTDPMGGQTGMGMNTAPPMPPMPPMASPGPGPIPPNPTTAMGDQTGAMPQIGQPPAPPPIGTPETGMASGPPPGVMYPPGGDPMQSAGLNPGGLPPKPGAPPPMPPGPPMSIAPPGGGVPPNPPPMVMGAGPDMAGQRAQARTILGRALGLDQNTEAQMRGSVGAGLKAAGENSNKGKGAAFMGSAGSAIEGGKGADDKTTDQQDKVLGRAIQSKTADQAATNAGVTNRLNEARTKLAVEQAKMTAAGGGSGVMNSPQQLYFKAIGAANQDLELKRLSDAHHQLISGGGDQNSKEAKAAMKAFTDRRDELIRQHFTAAGVDPKLADKLAKQPGMSQDNPMPSKGLTQDKLNALPPGTYVTGPDGKVMQKKAPVAPAAGANQPVPAQAMTPAVQPPLPPAVANARASAGADDEED